MHPSLQLFIRFHSQSSILPSNCLFLHPTIFPSIDPFISFISIHPLRSMSFLFLPSIYSSSLLSIHKNIHLSILSAVHLYTFQLIFFSSSIHPISFSYIPSFKHHQHHQAPPNTTGHQTHQPYDRFDCFVVVCSVVEAVLAYTQLMPQLGVSVLRCARLLRVFKATR